jgi:SIR2-like protein
MRRILLTGAGFSRNWGGWIASEAFEYLLGAPEIDVHLRYELWRTRTNGGGFEDTLANLQAAYHASTSPENRQRLEAMTAAIVGMFSAMRKSYAAERLEPDDRHKLWVMRFLAQFDAIFTLNQDTLLEDYYIGKVRWSEKWPGSYLPYMERLSSDTRIDGRVADSLMTPATHLALSPELQPYYKLHGSWTWYSGADRLLVIGANKAATIQTSNVLTKYHQEFAQQLGASGTRLMVIGYSFGDQHINEVICQAADKGQLRIFIIDKLGIDVLNKQRPRLGIRLPEVLVDRLSGSIIGASRRSLRNTFFRDPVELDKVVKFLQ